MLLNDKIAYQTARGQNNEAIVNLQRPELLDTDPQAKDQKYASYHSSDVPRHLKEHWCQQRKNSKDAKEKWSAKKSSTTPAKTYHLTQTLCHCNVGT
jgi:hypothetical protein